MYVEETLIHISSSRPATLRFFLPFRKSLEGILCRTNRKEGLVTNFILTIEEYVH